MADGGATHKGGREGNDISWPQGSAPLGVLLQRRGAATAHDVAASLSAQRISHARLGDILTARDMATPRAVAEAVAGQRGMPFVDLAAEAHTLPEAAQLSTCLAHNILPLRRDGGRLWVATTAPEDAQGAVDGLDAKAGGAVFALAEPRDFRRRLTSAYGGALAARAAVRRPVERSLRAPIARWQKGVVIACLMLTLICALMWPEGTLRTVFYVAAVIIATNCALWSAALIANACGAWGKPIIADQINKPLPRVSLLIPLYREPETAPLLIKSLRALDYPPELLDVKLVLEADDDETAPALLAQNPPGFVEILVTPDGGPRTKPRALNFALDFADGEIIGIYDAEDRPEPDQISRIVAQFAEAAPDVVCIQARLGWYNRTENWLTRCFEIEYASWFDVMLPGLRWLGLPMPLGGTSLFLRREAILALGGWDSHNVTEDADLGMLIARAGWRTALSHSMTEEEASCRVGPWIKQRSRWLKGYLATWTTHMRNPAALVRDVGWKRAIGLNVLLLSGVMGYLLLLPVLWLIAAMWWITGGESWAAQSTIDALVTLNLVIWTTLPILFFAAALGVGRRGWRRGLIWAFTLPLYWPLGSVAACIAVWELVVSPFSWRKTRHGVSQVAKRLNDEAREASP
ncbi:MAG: glycosyltransferase family 2 protein [Pikeienuella sp.]